MCANLLFSRATQERENGRLLLHDSDNEYSNSDLGSTMRDLPEENLVSRPSNFELIFGINACSSSTSNFMRFDDPSTHNKNGTYEPLLWKSLPQKKMPLSQKEIVLDVLQESAFSEDWLKANTQHSWWEDVALRSNCSSKSPLENIVSKEGSLDSKSESALAVCQITEYKLLREVLWRLQFPLEKLAFANCITNRLSTLPATSLSGVTQVSKESFLCFVSPYMDMVSSINTWQSELVRVGIETKLPPHTYLAYNNALQHALQVFSSAVADIELKVRNQDEINTLLTVFVKLSGSFKFLRTLFESHTKAVTDWQSEPNWLCSSRLLSSLFEQINQCSQEYLASVLLRLFLLSVRVYIDIIDVWLTYGRLEDGRNELFIVKEGGVSECNLRVVATADETGSNNCGTCSFMSVMTKMTLKAGHAVELLNRLGKLSILSEKVNNKDCLYKEFIELVAKDLKQVRSSYRHMNLQPDIESVINEDHFFVTSFDSQCGKNEYTENESAIKKIDVDPDVYSENEFENKNCMENEITDFVEKRELESVMSETAIPVVELRSSRLAVDKELSGKVSTQIRSAYPLLAKAVNSYHEPQMADSAFFAFNEKLSDNLYDQLMDVDYSLFGMIPIGRILKQNLQAVIASRHALAASILTDVVINEFKVAHHFAALRSVLLMEAGYLHNFSTYVFTQMDDGNWENANSLSVHLEYCLEPDLPELCNLFTVRLLGKEGTHTRDTNQAETKRLDPALMNVNRIHINYEVEWPISLLITPAALDSYNSMFRFLFSIKWALWTLNQLRFKDLTETPETILRVKRLYIARQWLLYSVITLQTHFMSPLLDAGSSKLERTLHEAKYIDTIIQAHDKYLEETKTHCLLSGNRALKQTIMTMLSLCGDLRTLWKAESTQKQSSLLDVQMHEFEEKYVSVYYCLNEILTIIVSNAGSANDPLFELWHNFQTSLPDFG